MKATTAACVLLVLTSLLCAQAARELKSGEAGKRHLLCDASAAAAAAASGDSASAAAAAASGDSSAAAAAAASSDDEDYHYGHGHFHVMTTHHQQLLLQLPQTLVSTCLL
ncbi:TPA: hypothetical protein ACH3X3_011362 [Trebouxia sp. C0006]